MKKLTIRNVLIIAGSLYFLVLTPKLATAANPTCVSKNYTATYVKSGNYINLSTPNIHLNGSSNAITLYGVNEGAWYGKAGSSEFTMLDDNVDTLTFKYNGQTQLVCSVPAATFVVPAGATGSKSTGGKVTTPITPVSTPSPATSTPAPATATPAAGTAPTAAPAAGWGQFTDVFGTNCSDYACWIKDVWNWALIIVVPLSTLMLAWAGFLWMTSNGDPTKIGNAKKIITGVVSGLLLLILAHVFIFNIIGLQSSVWNVN